MRRGVFDDLRCPYPHSPRIMEDGKYSVQHAAVRVFQDTSEAPVSRIAEIATDSPESEAVLSWAGQQSLSCLDSTIDLLPPPGPQSPPRNSSRKITRSLSKRSSLVSLSLPTLKPRGPTSRHNAPHSPLHLAEKHCTSTICART